MKKIFVTILAFSALFVSCSSPYYPEYVPNIALAASSEVVMCENNENQVSFNVISNVDYEATIISGTEWLSFANSKTTLSGSGNSVITLAHRANQHNKRVAKLLLHSGSRTDTVKVKQKGFWEEYLAFDKSNLVEWQNNFPLENNTQMNVSENGGEFAILLDTSCQDHEISFWTDYPEYVKDFRVENDYLKFKVLANTEGQPHIISVELSFIDGWEDKQSLSFTIRHNYDPLD